MQIFAIVVSLAIAAVGIALLVRAVREIIGVIKVGQPTSRTDNPVARTVTLVRETLGHTRMLQWKIVGIAHWFIFVGFGLLFFTLITAFGQLFDAHFVLPLIGSFFLFEWATELFSVVMVAAIIGFIAYRLSRPKDRVRGKSGRFYGSTMWWGYFVEGVILGVGLCILFLRGFEYALISNSAHPEHASALHFPFSFWMGELFSGLSTSTLENLIYLVAMLKIVISFAWMITISLNTNMGVAWHRFTVFFNIWFKREASGRTALGAMKPLTSDGKVVTLDDIEELDEDSALGVGKIEDFSWKGILDFSTCTECGRCQSQCPAWNTDKPLSPKLLITALRDHAYAKSPYSRADEGDRAALLEGNDTLTKEVERPLVGETEGWAWMPEGGAVIDNDVLWSCTSCGACVQQCPVDIEHVDHIMDMRRHQILVESNFPAELNGLFKGLENKGNPWNMSPNARLDWAKDLPFDVKVVGDDIEDLESVDWLFWVGCAGAYEDRAKKTTRAVAELLDMAGVTFGVLGNGETCTGDPARRAGNEFVFQGLAQQNVETFQEYKVKKVVSTCAHCFNTLKNEYKDFGIELEVVHHTQLLNRLVREGKLTPVKTGEGAAKRSITYHDPCYIGRHNGVYTPPRELLQVLPGAEYVEMERNSERSFCCGAGGARMWMEENIGERINVNRTVEAVGTGADQIAVGCPFCRVMLSDGLTAQQAKGEAREEVEVLDVAQMLLASVKGEVATKAKLGAAKAAPAAKKAQQAGGSTGDEATKAEPEAGDATQTENTVTATEDTGPAAKASGGSSLFDTPASEAEPSGDVAEKKPVSSVEKSGGSLFDTPAPAEDKSEEKGAEPKAGPAASGGSLFDLGSAEPEATTEAPAAEATPPAEPAAKSEPSTDLGSGGSLFDLGGPAEAAPKTETTQAEAPQAEAPKAEASTGASAAAQPASEIPSGGSLFDLAAPEPAAAPAPQAETAPEQDAAPAEEPQAETTEAPKVEAPKAEVTEAEAPKAEVTEAEAPATPAPAAAAPAQEIPEGGSLFDLVAPEPAAAPAPRAVAAPEPTAPQAEAPEAQAAPEPEVEAPVAEAPAPAAAPASPAPAATPAQEIPEGGSLFDLVAPEPVATPAPAAAQPEPQPEPEPAADQPVAPEPDTAAAQDTAPDAAPDAAPDPGAISEAATQAAESAAGADSRVDASDAEPAGDTEAAVETAAAEEPPATEEPAPAAADEAAPEAEVADEPKPAAPSSGAAHQPRTDVAIDESSSLFDL